MFHSRRDGAGPSSRLVAELHNYGVAHIPLQTRVRQALALIDNAVVLVRYDGAMY